jgi:diguanylate cyclase (GGDEF)-like protein/PAS domain S-box-containing protein
MPVVTGVTRRLFILSLLLAGAIFIVDLLAPPVAAAGVLYVALVLITLWMPKPGFTIVLTLTVTVLTLLGGVLTASKGDSIQVALANRFLILFAVWATALLALERKKTEHALEVSEERYGLAVRGALDGLWDWNLREGKIDYSPRWKSMLGWTEIEVGTEPEEWFSRIHPNDVERVRSQIDAHLDGQSSHFELDHRILHKDGNYRWGHARGLAVRDEAGIAYRMAGSLTDIDSRKRSEEQFRTLAIRDELTDLFNRRHFMERMVIESNSARRYGHPLSLCLCDLDFFKSINDTFGHQIGDKVLARFGRLTKNGLRVENIAARYGGDEFCILFPHTKAEMAAISLERLRSHFEKVAFYSGSGKQFATTATFGVADLPPGESDAKDLLESADHALYQAKAMGRNRVVIISSDKGMYPYEGKNE